MPFPRPETTPPVTKMYFTVFSIPAPFKFKEGVCSKDILHLRGEKVQSRRLCLTLYYNAARVGMSRVPGRICTKNYLPLLLTVAAARPAPKR